MGLSMGDIKPHLKIYIESIKLKADNCEHYRVIVDNSNVMCIICNCRWNCAECFNKINYGNFAWSKQYCCNNNCKHIENKKTICYSCKKIYNYYQVNEY